MYRVFYLIFLSLLCSCNVNRGKLKDEKLNSILTYEYEIKKPIEKIFVLNGYGCTSCNKRFSKFLENNNSRNTVYVISDNGQFFDKSKLRTDSIVVVYDYRNLLVREKIIKPSPAYIKIKNTKIDTIIYFSINNIEEELDYIISKD